MKWQPWQKQEDEFITTNHKIIPIDVMAIILDRTSNSISVRLNSYGLSTFRTKKPFKYTNSVHYKQALPEEQWPDVKVLIGIITAAKRLCDRTNKKANIDLTELKSLYKQEKNRG